MLKNKKPYIISVAIALAVGGLSAFLTRNSMDIYSTVNTPPFSPPSILFPIVWTILYVLMGISAAIVYTKRQEQYVAVTSALFVYGISLFLNFWWSIIFFNGRLFTFALIWLILLDLSVIATIKRYKSISNLAAYLQLPYLIWVLFATYLNLGIAILN
jgi:tryptophan-rich sensory protein